MENNIADEYYDEEDDNGGLAELDFNDGLYVDDTTQDQERDLQDLYDMLENGVDDSDNDPWNGFQIHTMDI